MDYKTQAYYQYFNGGGGGGGDYPVFRGARRFPQYGAGIGDFFRGLFRTMFPVALRGAATFVNEAVREQGEGASLGQAAKAALKPALGAVLNEVIARQKKSDAEKLLQAGSGKRKRKKKSKRRRQSTRVYKGGGGGGGGGKRKKKSSKKIKYNF